MFDVGCQKAAVHSFLLRGFRFAVIIINLYCIKRKEFFIVPADKKEI